MFDPIEIPGKKKMAPRRQQSEHCLATMSHDDYEANWNRQKDRHNDRQTDGQKAGKQIAKILP